MLGKHYYFDFDVNLNLQNKDSSWAPPMCDPVTHACKRNVDDGCSYSCIWKDECEDKIEITPVGQGFVCNCVKHDPLRHGFVWSCDNKGVNVDTSDTSHQFGSVKIDFCRSALEFFKIYKFRFARIPDINRDEQMGDTRQIKILHADQVENLDADNLNNVFSSSPSECLGIKNTNSTDGLVYYEFR